jgi:hypothetical protein
MYIDPAINLQPDTAATPGSSIIDSLETTAVNVVNAAANAGVQAVNGRMPYDPSDPNFGSAVVQVRGVQGGSTMPAISGGTILLLVLLYFVFRKKK